MNRTSKIAALEQQVLFLQAKIERLKSLTAAKKTPSPSPAKTREYVLARPPEDSKNFNYVIEADGGCAHNVPPYRGAYGSYKIGEEEVKRVKFGDGHSVNSAEIRIIMEAIKDLSARCAPQETALLIRSDSKIALKWVKCRQEPSTKTSANFQSAIQELRPLVNPFSKVTTEWRGRKHSVALFGH